MKKEHLYIAVIVALVVVASVAGYFAFENGQIAYKWQERAMQQDAPLEEGDEETLESEDAAEGEEIAFETEFINVNEEDLERLRKDTFFSAYHMTKVLGISPGTVLAISERNVKEVPRTYVIPERVVWLIDLDEPMHRPLMGPTQGDLVSYDVEVATAFEGGIISRYSSPGEAVGDLKQLYVDTSGNILGELRWGDYDQTRGHIGATIGSEALSITLISSEDCDGKTISYEAGVPMAIPTTTVFGLTVNGREFRTPQPLATECYVGYGDSISDPALSKPTFNGAALTLRLLGYQVSISQSGVVRYILDPRYTIPSCGYDRYPMRLLREDASGLHTVKENIWDDPALASLGENYHCFSHRETDLQTQRATFTIQTYDDASGPKDIGILEYDIARDAFLPPQLD